MRLILLCAAVSLSIAGDACSDEDAAKQAVEPKFPSDFLSSNSTIDEVPDSVAYSLDVFRGVNALCDQVAKCGLSKDKFADLKKLSSSGLSLSENIKQAVALLQAGQFATMLSLKEEFVTNYDFCVYAKISTASLERGVAEFEAALGTNSSDASTIVEELSQLDPNLHRPETAADEQKYIDELYSYFWKEYFVNFDAYKFHHACTVIASTLSTSEDFQQLKSIRNSGTLADFKAKLLRNCEHAKVESCNVTQFCAQILFWKP